MASRTTGAEFPATSPRFAKRPDFSRSSRRTPYDDEVGLLDGGPPHRFDDFKQNGKVFGFTSIIVFALLAFFTKILPLGLWNNKLFMSLFFFRYVRLIANTISWRLATPWPRSSSSPLPHEASVIIPTAHVTSKVKRCIDSALASGAATVIVSTPSENIAELQALKGTLSAQDQDRVQIAESRYANKRWQHFAGLRLVKTPFVVFKDDTVFWPAGKDFLRSALAPFEDLEVGGVGTQKFVVRKSGFINFLGCLYLDRHNMETVSTNRIDGGVWVISGRTCIYRTEIMKSKEFLQAYLNEMIRGFYWTKDSTWKWPKFWFGRIGSLNADDDLFMSRWMATRGHKLFFQIGDDATMYTNIDVTTCQFAEKVLRWFRGPWGRSNWRSVFEPRRVLQHPWTYYAVHVSGLINFAIIWDIALVYTFGLPEQRWILVLWILYSKLVKLLPHLLRNPDDVGWVIAYYPFTWIMSGVKFWAMLSYSDISWGSRKNVQDGPRDYVVTDEDLGTEQD